VLECRRRGGLEIGVSTPMSKIARSRAALAYCPHLVFREGVFQKAELPASTDLLFCASA
jgi:hypothetical protein